MLRWYGFDTREMFRWYGFWNSGDVGLVWFLPSGDVKSTLRHLTSPELAQRLPSQTIRLPSREIPREMQNTLSGLYVVNRRGRRQKNWFWETGAVGKGKGTPRANINTVTACCQVQLEPVWGEMCVILSKHEIFFQFVLGITLKP